MKYKLLMVFALLGVLLLGGCVNQKEIDNRKNYEEKMDLLDNFQPECDDSEPINCKDFCMDFFTNCLHSEKGASFCNDGTDSCLYNCPKWNKTKCTKEILVRYLN